MIKIVRIKHVENDGLGEVQKFRAWSDHALTGKHKGQRAISPNGAWRAIYEVKGEKVEFVDVMEVTPHDY